MININCVKKMVLITVLLLANSMAVQANECLQNAVIRADFDGKGLIAIHNLAVQNTIGLVHDDAELLIGDDHLDTESQPPVLEFSTETNRIYRLQSGRWTVRIIYELAPQWHFLTKRVEVSAAGSEDFCVHHLELLRGQLDPAPQGDMRQRGITFLRYPGQGLFVTLQNPFGEWKREGGRISLGYSPDIIYTPGSNAFMSDRVCIGVYTPSGITFPNQMTPVWKLVPTGTPDHGPQIDLAEVDAAVDCSRSFLSYHPTIPERVMIGWCVNDYQIDIGKPDGRTEYKRIIDQVAAIGAKDILFAPANSLESSLDQNRDAWGWENSLWFTMGQKLRKGEWDPANDPLPTEVQEMVNAAKAKDIKLMAYVYPSLPFMQQKEWTDWITNGQPGGYRGADTGQRNFQDWLIGKLVDFQKATGAGGFSFDHWWIAYDAPASSHYAQWAGCRRILEDLRQQIPDAVIDGRQQYHNFGVWTWLAGSYPHPLVGDEQPESFPAFPDLHWDRVSADRQRRASWYYRQECFAPVEIIPGYMTHQTPRIAADGSCPRDRFRPADWDLLGWKYSVISAIASGPYHLIINNIPARSVSEFKAFSAADQKWFRDWFDWTEHNIDVLKNVKPIIGAPQIDRVDGWAAFKGKKGFVFLFNPNYRELPADFVLDDTIGLKAGGQFVIKQLYPDAQKGRLLAAPGNAFWHRGDTVHIPMAGAEAVVWEVAPAPASITQPWLAGAIGQAALHGKRLELKAVRGEVGTEQDLVIALPADASINALNVNGVKTDFHQNGSQVIAKVHFAGVPFSARQPVGVVDPQFAGTNYQAETAIPDRVFKQLAARKQSWPVDYTDKERAAVWLNSDRLLLYINIAEPDDEKMADPVLRVDGEKVPVKCAYTSIVRNNPHSTFTGWYADITSLKPEVKHQFEVELPTLKVGQFQGLFFDTVEAEYTSEIVSDK